MAQRALAVLGAVAMVIAAIVVRAAMDDGAGPGNASGGGGDGALEIICAADLKPACDGIEGAQITYQQAGATATLIEHQSPELAGVDGWVTSSAWAEVLASRAPGRLGPPVLLGTTRVVVGVDPDRTEAVRALCAGGALWRCLGDNAGRQWGELGSGGSPDWHALKSGLPAADSATGLGVLASVASGFFGSADFASNDFDPQGFEGWLAALAEPSGGGEEDPTRILATVQGKYTAVGDVAASASRREISVLEPTPAISVAAVMVALPGGDDLPDPAPIRDGLISLGWVARTSDSLAPATLKPGVMAALHTLWTEVTR